MQRVVLSVTVGILVVVLMGMTALSVGAQSTEQGAVCAPWSKEWDLSKGWWYFTWYRWCYDPAVSDPAVADSWYREWGTWEWWDQANLCPESGTCFMSTG